MSAARTAGMGRAALEGPEGRDASADGGELEALRDALDSVAHHLPDQAPLAGFVHHNTLHAFEELEFHDALARAAALFGATPYPKAEWSRAQLRARRIREADLAAALDERHPRSEALPGGLEGRAVRWAALVGDLADRDEPTVAFALTEGELMERPPEGLDRTDWLERAAARLRARIADEGEEGLRALLATATSEREVRERFGDDARALGEALDASPAPVVLRAVFAHARRLACAEGATRTRPRRHRDALRELTGVDVDEHYSPTLVRWSAAYLDAGLAYWPMPSRALGFHRAVCELARRGGAAAPGWRGRALRELARQGERGEDAPRVIRDRLRALGVERAEWPAYLEAELLALPGWAAMFRRLELRAEERMRTRPYRLDEFLAVRLTLSTAALEHELARRRLAPPLAELREAAAVARAGRGALGQAHRLFSLFVTAEVDLDAIERLQPPHARALEDVLDRFSSLERGAVLLEAYERTYRRDVLDALSRNAARIPSTGRADPPWMQVVCCLDDREESLRRHLEEADGAVETFGAPGFFGLAIAYQALETSHTQALCPVAQIPTHTVFEVAEDPAAERAWRRRRSAFAKTGFAAHVGSRGLVRGLGISMAGALHAAPMVLGVLAPRSARRAETWLQGVIAPRPATTLTAFRPPHTEPGVESGFTVEEAAERLARLLEDMGLTSSFAPLLVLLGHGGVTTNNPHAAMYECGACAGGKGGPNARLAAMLLNDPRVRERLARAHGVRIPATTWVVGGSHDTCTDAIALFDLRRAPETHRAALEDARRVFDVARRWDAHERVRRFHTVPLDVTPERALRIVEARSASLAEPRPEYGHCTNSLCFVGRRARTRGLFLDRRAFLVSYDPTTDPDGRVLERLLASVGPVGAGINLEYYFSTVDQARFGAGSKLPHNVTGLVGVMDGHESDLRTGLPHQTVDVHEPMRLLLVVEATPQRLVQVARSRLEVGRLVSGGWVTLVSQDPESGALAVSRPGGFEPFTPSAGPVPWFARSVDAYRDRRDAVPPSLLGEGAASQESRHA
ncbi:MAG: DUF2309 domain-containing protein [Sandaracinaceae bacterium]